MILKYHQTLTEEKWSAFPFYKQLIMIGNELNRAKNWIEDNDIEKVKTCYERAFELFYLTISCLKDMRKLKELLRAKEMLGALYMEKTPNPEENIALLKALLSLDKNSFAAAGNL